MKKICFVTGARADYGLLRFLIEDMSKVFSVQIIATGMHLSKQFGETYREIEADGLKIDEKVDLKISGDSSLDVTKAMSLAVSGFGEAYARLKPDLIFVLGDRYEIFAAVQAALVALIPVAHIAGGDTTEGAIDEAFRHGITKMSHLHFATNPVSAHRVRQMGENAKYVFDVGHIGVDSIRRTEVLSKQQIEEQIEFKLKKTNLLITFHPPTLDSAAALNEMKELLSAVEKMGEDCGLIFTLANSDTNGGAINKMIEDFCAKHKNSKSYAALGRVKYLNLMRYVDVVVGNSSSGIYEAPALKIPAVNIGDRQKGRLMATSVLNCPADQEKIFSAIQKAMKEDWSQVKQPYGDGHATERIVKIVQSIDDFAPLIHKHFFMLE